MKHYFDEAMRALHEDAKLFAKQYPNHARYLNLESLSDIDPNVERLLEGFCYLSGKIQHQIDNGFQSVSQLALASINPELAHCRPSNCIVQYKNKSGSFSFVDIKKGEKLVSEYVGEETTRCDFELMADLSFYLIDVVDVYQHSIGDGLYQIDINLQANGNSETITLDELTFYISGELDCQLAWIYLLFHSLQKATLSIDNVEHPADIVGSELFVGSSEHDLYGYQILKNYFCFKDGFMFFRVKDFPEIALINKQTFTIRLMVSEPMADHHLSIDNTLKLGCVPAINQYQWQAEPISLVTDKAHYPLIMDSSKRQSILLKEVESVVNTTTLASFQPFRDYEPNMGDALFYRVHALPQQDINQLTLSGLYQTEENLSISAKVCNGFYPRRYLPIGALKLLAKSEQISATNITRPCEFVPANNDQDYYITLLGALTENYSSLFDLSRLKQLLNTVDVHQSHKKQIDSIVSVKNSHYQLFKQGVLYQGLAIDIQLDDGQFTSSHEAYFFGYILHIFFSKRMQINYLLTTKIHFVHNSKGYVYGEPDEYLIK